MGCEGSFACESDWGDRKAAGEFAFLQYLEWTEPLDNADKLLGCIYVLWSTDDEVDPTAERITGGGMKTRMIVREWFGLEPLPVLREL